MSKRTSDQFLELDDAQLEYQLEGMKMDSCDVVRRKIRSFIDSGEMKVGEFQKTIGCNSKSYSSFMTQKGPFKGSGSSVYGNAWEFFKMHELRGIKMPKKKARTDAGVAEQVDLSAVTLPGEEADAVEVYDTCDEIRRKISAHLQKSSVTQAQFLRSIASQFRLSPKTLQSKQLADFRSRKGPDSGNTSSVYNGSYVFFEKMRVVEGKPKSKKRMEMERIWGAEGGMDTERRRDRVWAHRLDKVFKDSYGRLNVVPGPRDTTIDKGLRDGL